VLEHAEAIGAFRLALSDERPYGQFSEGDRGNEHTSWQARIIDVLVEDDDGAGVQEASIRHHD
jgi:hypothetical protein